MKQWVAIWVVWNGSLFAPTGEEENSAMRSRLLAVVLAACSGWCAIAARTTPGKTQAIHIKPGDRLVTTVPASGNDESLPYVQGFVTVRGRKVLLVNRSNQEEMAMAPAGFEHALFTTVDEATGDDPPRTGTLSGPQLTLAPFAVTVLTAE